jgi:DNA-binding beta-propeller fold protein YncE
VASTTGDLSLTVAAAPAGTVTTPEEIAVTATNVGSTTTSAGNVDFALSAGTVVSSVLVVTEGYTGKDFTNSGTGTCIAQTYASPATCTVVVNFAPLYPGPRIGAVELLGGDNNVLATSYISGVGDGPAALFQPGTQKTIATESGTSNFDDVAVDIMGNAYVVDYPNHQVLKETSSSGNYTQSTAFSSLSGPKGMAIDGAGNIYIADTASNTVYKETLVNGTYTQTTVGSGLNSPDGVAVDANGNVYIADSVNNRVLLETLSEGTYTQSVIDSGLNNPWRVGVDVGSNVYVADTGNNRVLLETLSNGTYTQSTIVSGLSAPTGVAVDGNGTIYIADTGNNRILEEQLVSGSYVQTVLVTGLNAPRSVAVDELGNLYISDFGDNKLYKQDYSDPPSLTFASTPPGTLSSDSPQTVTLVNFGNAALAAVSGGIAAPTDFPQATGNGSDCTTSFSLASTANCTLRIEFYPQAAGTKNESFIVTDNNLNSSPTAQTLTVTGNSAAISIAISPSSVPTASLGALYNLVLSASGGTSPYTFTILTGSLPTGLTLSTGGVLSGTPTAAGTFNFTIQAQDSTSGEGGGPYTGSRAYSITIAAPTIVVSPDTLPNGTVGSTYSQELSASGGSGSYTYAVTGGTLPAGLSLNATTGALSGTPTAAAVSTFVITATDTITTGSGAPYKGSQSFSVTVTQPSPTRSSTTTAIISSVNPALVESSVKFTATVTAESGTPIGSVNFLDGSTLLGSGSLSGRVATLSTSSLKEGSHSITASYSGDSNFVASTSSALSENVIDFRVGVGSGGSSGSGESGAGASQSISPGGTAVYSVSITPTTGTSFPTITYLTVTGLPAGATATLNTKGWTEMKATEWSLPAFAQLSDVSLSFYVPPSASTSAQVNSAPSRMSPILAAFFSLPLGAMFWRSRRRIRSTVTMVLLVALSAAGLAWLSACGSKNGFFAPQPNSYVVTVTVTTGALSHSTNLSLTVQ